MPSNFSVWRNSLQAGKRRYVEVDHVLFADNWDTVQHTHMMGGRRNIITTNRHTR